MNIEDYFKERDLLREKQIKKMYDLNSYPEHLRKIVQVILNDGEMVTDGIVYYARWYDILVFASHIYKVTRK
jgi:hypothetical protein